ncbi:MAG: tetratricopeptide repeat protein, partial [bacterium]
SLGGADAYLFGLLAYAYAAQLDYPAAEAAYRNALMFQPDSMEWRMGLCRVAFKQGKFEEAASLLEAMLVHQPDRAEFWILQANAYVGMKKPLKAAENLEVVVSLGKATPEILHMLGDIYVNEQLHALAAAAYERALRADSETGGKPDRHVKNVEALAARGALSEADALRQSLVRSFGDQLSSQAQGRLLRVQAKMAAFKGEGAAVAQALEDALKLDPLDGDVLMLLAQHYAGSGDTEKACLYFERAAGIERFEADARLKQAQCLVKNGRFQDAVPLIKRVQEIRPREDVARYLEQVERVARSRN